ncbi:MAG TPA: nitroreductase family protein [Acidimicrobiales bacterium]|nr:nitroreductase family protein [Acidimicrobiales bacterium]
MELYESLRKRRMVRAFEPDPIDPVVLDRVVQAGLRGPSAGFTQGVDLLVLSDQADRAAFWAAETDRQWRDAHPDHETTRRAPVIALPLTGAEPYTRRYSEPDKAAAGLQDAAAWPVPFWWFDAGAAVMAILLAATAEGLGALFMGVFRGETALREAFAIPAGLAPAGAVLLGYPAHDCPSPSLARGHRPVGHRVHDGRFGRAWPKD